MTVSTTTLFVTTLWGNTKLSKETYYFSHDYTAAGDMKIQALIGEYGRSGYGVYWYIIEQLHQEETHWLPMKEYLFLAIAKQMKANAEQIETVAKQVEDIIKYCIFVCDLFVSKGEMFTSRRVLKNFEKRSEISEKRRLAGKKGASAKQNLASAKQNLAKSSKGKERKGKETKENIIYPQWEEFFNYCKENGFSNIAERAFKGYAIADWHDAQGKKIINWKQKLLNGWFKPENGDNQQSLFNQQQLPPQRRKMQ